MGSVDGWCGLEVRREVWMGGVKRRVGVDGRCGEWCEERSGCAGGVMSGR